MKTPAFPLPWPTVDDIAESMARDAMARGFTVERAPRCAVHVDGCWAASVAHVAGVTLVSRMVKP